MSNIYDSIMKTINCTSFYKIFYNKTLNRKYDAIRKINKIIIIFNYYYFIYLSYELDNNIMMREHHYIIISISLLLRSIILILENGLSYRGLIKIIKCYPEQLNTNIPN
jgi:hypothetical protein